MNADPSGSHSVDVDAVAAAVMRCPSVMGLSAGTSGEVKTHLPGRRINGVKVVEDGIDVHVVARWVRYLPDVAQDVRRLLAPLAAGRAINVFIDDVAVDDGAAVCN
jgi:hypothetical protein